MTEPAIDRYSPEEFERQYNARLLVPDSEEIVARLTLRSEDFRAEGRSHLDLPYGPAGREKLDVFPGQGDKCPVLVYIHGGYWRSRDKASYSFVAEPLTAAGVTVVITNYSHCPHVTLDQIVRQLRDACAWTWNHIDEYGGDPQRIHVCGNSAGGQLSAMMAATEWPELDHQLPPDLIKGGMSLSGLFDLEPLLSHTINDTLNLDAAMAKRNSPLHLRPTLAGPFICAVGGDESTEFERQSRDFVAAWKAAGAAAEFVSVARRNHFTIVADLMQPDYVLLRRLQTLVGVK